MARVCFASYEIAPTTKGGAGVLLRNVAEVLLAEGHEVIFLLDLPAWEYEAFVNRDRFLLPAFERCRAYHVASLVDGATRLQEDDFASHFMWRAYRFHEACRVVYEDEHPDVIEFFDYGGVGLYALAAKVAGLGYEDAQIAVRLHTSLELMDRVSADTPLSLDRECAYALEHGALRLAEAVLYPTPSYLEEAYLPYYEPWLGSLVESPPPIVDVPPRRRRRPQETVILFYGRLSGLKGVDLFLDAALAMLRDGDADGLVFYLVGFDPSDPDATHQSGAALRRRIPSDLQDRFVFTGQWSRGQLNRLLPRVRLAVFPTYLESFGYAAHELRAAGVPLVLSSIPAFRDHFAHEVNALLFDGSVEDLHRQMARLAADADLRERLAESAGPVAPDTHAYYEDSLPQSWIAPRRAQDSSHRLLVCVLAEDERATDATLESLHGVPSTEILVLRPSGSGGSSLGTFRFLGRLWKPETPGGEAIEPVRILTRDALLVLNGGDVPHDGFLPTCVGILDRQPEMSFAGSWKRRGDGTVDTSPVDIMPEAIPFMGTETLTRCVLRTRPDHLLVDLFDHRAGALGELRYLAAMPAGVIVPAALISVSEEQRVPSPEALAYTIMTDESVGHARRLARLRGAVATGGDDGSLLRAESGDGGRAARIGSRSIRTS